MRSSSSSSSSSGGSNCDPTWHDNPMFHMMSLSYRMALNAIILSLASIAHAYILIHPLLSRNLAKKKRDPKFSMNAKPTELERVTGKRRREELTVEEQVERFPFLKDAPLEGGERG